MILRLCGLFICAAATASAQTPVMLESRVDAKGNGEAVITNLKAVPLTAYLIQVFLEPCSPTPRPDVFHAADAALNPDTSPLSPSKTRTESLGASYCNKVGASVPGRAELKAAIYQDGSSFGEPQWVKALLDARRLQLQELNILLNQLNAREPGSGFSTVRVADLQKRLTNLQAERAFPFPPVLDISALASESLKAEKSSPEQITRAVTFFEQLRNKVLEAKPSLH